MIERLMTMIVDIPKKTSNGLFNEICQHNNKVYNAWIEYHTLKKMKTVTTEFESEINRDFNKLHKVSLSLALNHINLLNKIENMLTSVKEVNYVR